MHLTSSEVNVWFNWAVNYVTGRMKLADAIFVQHSDIVLKVARELARSLKIFGEPNHRKVYRGLQFFDANIKKNSILPYWPSVPVFSFSEDINVACFFGDPNGMGATTRAAFGEERLGDHGYVVETDIGANDVMFHWSYVDRISAFDRAFGPKFFNVTRQQKEVTVVNTKKLKQRVLGHFPDPCPDPYEQVKKAWMTAWT